MLILRGRLLNLLYVPEQKTKEGKTWGGYHKLQVMTQEPQEGGGDRMTLHDLSTDQPQIYRDFVGKEISLQVSAWARGGAIHYRLVDLAPEAAR